MNDDTDLNKILQKRVVAPPATNLSARIIEAAKTPQKTSYVYGLVHEIKAMIILPRPAYALAFSLILGLVLGFQVGIEGDVVMQDWFLFAAVEEGDWL